jgi:DNA replication and repair protein RecF
VHLASLELRDFRRYAHAALALGPGVTVLEGANGAGKTTVLEAAAWVALGRSFRGVPDATLVRDGADAAVVRATVVQAERHQTLDAELRRVGRNRVLVNGHALTRTRDRLDLLRVTIFTPDDLALVKGGPAGRREYLDDLLGMLAPRYEAARADYDRVLRHRNALLKGGLRGPDAPHTLEVFDDQLVRAGAEIVRGRLRLVERLGPHLRAAYTALAGRPAEVTSRYEAEWAPDGLDPDTVEAALRAALPTVQRREVERGVTLVGPHRDEWRLLLEDMDVRTHASQGEQRCIALALRLAGHAVCSDAVGTAPVLLLDDVFSELDAARADALVAALPTGQTLVTTATAVPAAVRPELHLRVEAGRIVGGSS